jgi:adenylate kinase family enzyme
MRRIAIVGDTGSGKTTLARRVAERLNAPCVELDALHWGPNWSPISGEGFRGPVARLTVGDSWVMDGNYSELRDIVWARADTLVWLDYSLLGNTWRLLKRTYGRVRRHEELWNGNRETWWGTLFATDALLRYLWASHWRRRRAYVSAVQDPRYRHLTVARLGSPRQMERWLAGI